MAPARFLPRPSALVALAAALLVGGALVIAPVAHADTRPTAIVSMGDSYVSGEAAGDYEPGTDQPGNFCHRSRRSQIHTASIPSIDAEINLACSGATTQNVQLGGSPKNGEAPQAEQLRAVARDYDVQMIVLTVGANNVGFGSLVLDCIRAYFLIADACEDVWRDRVPQRLAATVPLIRDNLRDIRTVMREAGHADGDYQLVLQSYSSPVNERNRYWWAPWRSFEGCPFQAGAHRWAYRTAVPQFAQYMKQAAQGVAGVRFLDLNRAFTGREVCAPGIGHGSEWVLGVYIDIAQIRNGLGSHIVQQSVHPNARGHAQMGRCLTEFYALAEAMGHCARGSDGNLHARPGATV